LSREQWADSTNFKKATVTVIKTVCSEESDAVGSDAYSWKEEELKG
jgi:hypothetical protein